MNTCDLPSADLEKIGAALNDDLVRPVLAAAREWKRLRDIYIRRRLAGDPPKAVDDAVPVGKALDRLSAALEGLDR